MRIAVVHSFYRSQFPSGENIAVRQQVSALRRAGNDVFEIYRSSDDEMRSSAYRIKAAWRVASGFDAVSPVPDILDSRPDVVSVHNLFPNFGNRWLANVSVPVVATLHNFRSACANGLLFRDGHPCLNCATGSSLAAVRHRCYRESAVASLPLAVATSGGVSGDRLLSNSSAVICQSPRVLNFMRNQGLPPRLLHFIPGFVEETHSSASLPPSVSRFVFAGRATPEKGLGQLLELWPREMPLDVIGSDGPGASEPTPSASTRFLGVRDRGWVVQHLQEYSGLVFPGRVWEGALPLVVREALEAGLPVIALEGSGASDLVTDLGVGRTYTDGSRESLLTAIQGVLKAGNDLRMRCRMAYEAHLTERAWSRSTVEVFKSVLSAKDRSGRS